MNKKFQLDYVEFYITNVCNLTCQGCNRFNSFKFKGWQKWEDYADTYKQWSEQIEFRESVPVSNIGKVLRRVLREEAIKK